MSDVIEQWKSWHRELSSVLECKFVERRITLNSAKELKSEFTRLQAELEKTESKMLDYAADYDDVKKESAALQAQLDAANEWISAVTDIINHSDGVQGWHLNGDIAPWGDLLSIPTGETE